MSAIYTAVATATGDGRNGEARTSDGLLEVDLAVPTEMGGAGGATNPEQLFAVGYAACFHSALKMVARQAKAQISDSAVTSEVSIHPKEEGGFQLSRRPARGDVRRRPGHGGQAGPGSPPGLPVLERHPRQHRGGSGRRRRLIRPPRGPNKTR